MYGNQRSIVRSMRWPNVTVTTTCCSAWFTLATCSVSKLGYACITELKRQLHCLGRRGCKMELDLAPPVQKLSFVENRRKPFGQTPAVLNHNCRPTVIR